MNQDAVEDSGDSLLKAVLANSDQVRSKLKTQKEYDDLIAGLEKIKKSEEEKGKFITQEGDIDQRGSDKKDI